MVRTSMGDLLASQVIVATPIAAARALIGAHCPRLGQLAETLDSPHVASIGLAYDRGHVNRWIDSFGLLVASDGPPPGGADVLGMLSRTFFVGQQTFFGLALNNF